jgi:hypothetical protein
MVVFDVKRRLRRHDSDAETQLARLVYRGAVRTPKVFASTLAAMQQVVSAMTGATPTGRPRKAGSTCCSTEA